MSLSFSSGPVTAPVQPNRTCYDEPAKQAHKRRVAAFFRVTLKQLAEVGAYTGTVRFNAGGIAVWGETYLKVSLNGVLVVESYDTHMGMLVRQTNGSRSGRNHYVHSQKQLVAIIQQLAAAPFAAF
jgi:hypothetical protein